MKTASTIFIVLGMLINFASSYIFGIIGVVVGVSTLISLYYNKKIIIFGILSLLFAGLLGGIFYFCWNPNDNK